MWLTSIFIATAALFLAMTLAALFHLRWVHRLPSWEWLSGTGGFSSSSLRCSVVIAARDEESRIEQTIRHLLAQRDVELQVIVVDDRSTDGTGAILRRLAAEDPRVQVSRVEVLPKGWLGKCHACYVGAKMAKGEWILFTDADCWLKPDVISRALHVAKREEVEHITLTPGVAPQSLSARTWHVAFLISLANWFSGVNRNRPKSYLGMGAFNLVRADAYRQCGGYEALRLTVLDDVRLGLLLRRAGKRTRGLIGGDDAQCHWGMTARSMIKVMEKNYFAAVDFRLATALGAGLGGIGVWIAALMGLCTGTAAGIAAGLAWLSLVMPAGVVSRRCGWGWSTAAMTPLIYPALFYALLNSTFLTLWRGGIRWRGTFYSLDELRAGAVR